MASMKLRVRAAGGGPTIKVQIPLLCTLQGLKDALGPLISLPPASFSLSLNKKDEIQGPGSILLASFGVTSGDLLFYIVHSGRSSPIPLTGSPSSRLTGSATPTESGVARASVPSIDGPEAIPSGGGRPANTPSSRRELCAAAAARRAATTLATEPEGQIAMAGSDSTVVLEQTLAGGGSETRASTGVVTPSSSIPPTAGAVTPSSSSIPPIAGAGPEMDLEADEAASPELLSSGGAGHRLVPIPDLLQRVLNTEFENIRQPSTFLVLAVHSVMLETGFLRIESRSTGTNNSAPAESRTVDGYGLPPGWSGAGLVNLSYTLPELRGVATVRESGHEALLRCQIVGNAVVVYGAVTGGSVHRVSLPASRFLLEHLKLPMLGSTGASSSGGSKVAGESLGEDVESAAVNDGARGGAVASMGENIFRDIFQLWKEVKDSLSLPLLSFMCEATGLPPPPSLLRLPTELKIKVLDSLPSVALANLACACSEFRFLASGEELWKQKYKEEFGASGERAPGGRGWKSAFVREFEHRRRREEERRQAERRYLAEVFPPGVILRPPTFSPHFTNFFQGLGSDPSQFNLPRDVRCRRISSGNYGGAFPNMGLGTSYGDLDGASLPGIFLDGHGERAWPPLNNLGSRGPRSGFGRLDGDHVGNGGGPAL